MKNVLQTVIVAVGLLGLITAAWAAGNEPYLRLSSSDLKVMMERPEKDLVIIDSRSTAEYQEAHIKGAVSLPLSVQESTPSSLAFAKDAKIVFYCNGFS
jgi:predicted sulfurtransferase